MKLARARGREKSRENIFSPLHSRSNDIILNPIFHQSSEEGKQKMFKRMTLTAVALLAVTGYGADGITIDNAAGSQTGTNQKVIAARTAEREKDKKLAELNSKRTALIRKLHEKRQNLLKNNPKLRRMHQQLLKQARELALELNANREMSSINDELSEVERQLKNELESQPAKQPVSNRK